MRRRVSVRAGEAERIHFFAYFFHTPCKRRDKSRPWHSRSFSERFLLREAERGFFSFLFSKRFFWTGLEGHTEGHMVFGLPVRENISEFIFRLVTL